MPVSTTLRALTTLALAFCLALAQAQTAAVSFLVDEQIAASGHADVLAVFGDFPDLSAAEDLATKEDKARYVFGALRQNARRHAALLTQLEARGIDAEHLWIANAVHVSHADRAAVDLLRGAEGVAEVTAVQTWQIDELERESLPTEDLDADGLSARGASTTWGIRDLGADQVWDMGIRGAGAVVAGGDTGYDWTHPALQSQYRGTVEAGGDVSAVQHDYHWWDGVKSDLPGDDRPNPCGFDARTPCDDGNHGTHTMGTMVGRDGDAHQIGVAPEASWIACRNMDRSWGAPVSYLSCFQFFLAPTDLNGENPRPEMAPDVIANSWYCPEVEGCFADTYASFDNAVAALRAAGTVVVASAGNAGRGGCNTINDIPARVPGAFAVGAHNEAGDIAGFSSRGSYERDSLRIRPDVTMPGVAVRSSVPPGNYDFFSGTSMAGPHAAGVVALMISANPQLCGQVDTIESILRRSARPTAAPNDSCSVPGQDAPNNAFGYGRGNALRAVEMAQAYSGIVNVREAAALDFAVSPNPADDRLTVDLPAALLGAQLTVADITGRVVVRRVARDLRVELQADDWPAGAYVVTVRGAAGARSERVLIR